MAKTADTPAPTDEPSSGKGRPTPSRAEREAANRRPLAPQTKEARAAQRTRMNEARQRANDGFAKGEEKYLPARDKGPQRRWVRDYVDAGWHLAEFVMPAMIFVLVLTFIPDPAIVNYAFLAMMIFVLFVIGDMIVLSHNVKKKIAEKFGADRRERGLGWYAAMRAMQMRFLRMPKPQAKRGEYPEL